MQERLRNLLPELDLIQDTTLRDQVIAVWVAALEESAWSAEDLARMPFTLLVNPCPVSFIEHVRAVTQTVAEAARIFAHVYGERVPLDFDALVAGGLLHDIGKLAEYEPAGDSAARQSRTGALLRHPFLGVALASRFGLPAPVLHIIATHGAEGDRVPRSVEATLVNHADFMHFHAIQRLQAGAAPSARLG